MKNLKSLIIVFSILFSLQFSYSQESGPFSGPYPAVSSIISSDNKLVLDLPAGSKMNNKEIVPYEFNRGPNQLWCLFKEKKGYVIVSAFSNKVLSVNEKDSILVQQGFTDNKLQYWQIIKNKKEVQIYNEATNLYITSTIRHTPVMLIPQTGEISQKWTIINPWSLEIYKVLLK